MHSGGELGPTSHKPISGNELHQQPARSDRLDSPRTTTQGLACHARSGPILRTSTAAHTFPLSRSAIRRAHCDHATTPVRVSTRASPSPTVGMAHAPRAHPNPSRDAMGPAEAAGSQPDDLQCCCGRGDCVYLKHNCSVLSGVERDVHTAAKMGQVSSSCCRIPSSMAHSFERAATAFFVTSVP